jgi:hypothetical protein
VLRSIALISLVYDLSIGVALLFLRPQLQSLIGVAAPEPPIHADLNALFVTTVGVGYLLPYRDPIRYRAYLWIFGVALKSAGALTFLVDYTLRGSPAAFLLFAVSDAAVAGLTLTGLWLSPAEPPIQRNP